MPSYIVKEPLKHDGATYAPGAAVDMDAKDAAGLLALGVLAEDPDAAKAEKKGK